MYWKIKSEVEGKTFNEFEILLSHREFEEVRSDVFLEQIIDDMKWTALSFLALIVMFMIHLKSKFLTVISLWLILLSFPVTTVITEGIF